MNVEEYFAGLAEHWQENVDFYGKPLTRWQKFRNWWAKLRRKPHPFTPLHEWTPEQMKKIEESP